MRKLFRKPLRNGMLYVSLSLASREYFKMGEERYSAGVQCQTQGERKLQGEISVCSFEGLAYIFGVRS